MMIMRNNDAYIYGDEDNDINESQISTIGDHDDFAGDGNDGE